MLNIVFQRITPIGLESTHISGKLPANWNVFYLILFTNALHTFDRNRIMPLANYRQIKRPPYGTIVLVVHFD